MDRAEALVIKHLKSRGYVDIVHEPEGKVPPDFLLDGGTAVEVKRLNETEEGGQHPRGLAEVEIPLWVLTRIAARFPIPLAWRSMGTTTTMRVEIMCCACSGLDEGRGVGGGASRTGHAAK